MPADLSIVIPTHNRPDLLRACLETVARHAPEKTQIIVVDDASPRGAAGAVAASFARAQVVRFGVRQGFCKAANAGIARAAAPVIAMLNDDTEVTAGWAHAALNAFRDQAIGAVAPLVLRWPDGNRIDSAGDRYYIGGIAGKRGHGEEPGPPHLQRQRVFGASASCAFYRREALARVGAFPESFGAYFEDVDLSFRLNRAGFRVLYEPAARVLHHVSASHGSPDGRLLEQQSCNEEMVFWRNLPTRSLARAVPIHLGVLAAKGWRRWREGRLLPFLYGRLRALAAISSILQHRRFVARLGGRATAESLGVEMRRWPIAK